MTKEDREFLGQIMAYADEVTLLKAVEGRREL